MASIEVVKVLMHYTVQGEMVLARVREYAGEAAFLESTREVHATALTQLAQAQGLATWDEQHVLSLAQADHWIESKEALLLAKDILSVEEMQKVAPGLVAEVVAELTPEPLLAEPKA